MKSDKTILLSSLEYALMSLRLSTRYKEGVQTAIYTASVLDTEIDKFKEEFKGEL